MSGLHVKKVDGFGSNSFTENHATSFGLLTAQTESLGGYFNSGPCPRPLRGDGAPAHRHQRRQLSNAHIGLPWRYLPRENGSLWSTATKV